MSRKAMVSYGGGLAASVVIAVLLRRWGLEELGWALGWLAMLLIGFVFTRDVAGKHLSFARWAVFSTLGTAVAVVLLRHL